jgi:DNA-binding Lrp family transcriptional regulator
MFAAVLDLADRLPPDLQRARINGVAALVALTRDALDRQARGIREHGQSINGLAASLGLPFETVRRHVHRLIAAGWLVRSANAAIHVDLDRSPIRDWCAGLPQRLQRITDDLDRAGIATPDRLRLPDCEPALVRTALDLILSMASAAPMFDMSFGETLFVHFVCGNSVSRLGNDMALAATISAANAPPPDPLRAFVPLTAIAVRLGISRSTAHRLAAKGVEVGFLERRGASMRATGEFLAGDLFVDALRSQAGSAATLLTRLHRHRCPSCATPPLDRLSGAQAGRVAAIPAVSASSPGA